MPGPFATPPLIFAQAAGAPAAGPAPAAGQAQAAPAGKAPATAGSPFAGLLPFVPVIILFYFLLIRPQRKQESERRKMVDALKRNDRVLTNSGIFGTVTGVDADSNRVTIRVDDEKNVRIDFARSAIAQVIAPKSAEKPAVAAEI